jgi:4'-phosphopantetheinyl transferase
MNVYWLEQTEAEVPSGNDWLSENEILCRNGLRFPKRRADWQLGRWTAKCAVAACLKIPTNSEVLARLEIRARPSGAPQVFVANKPVGLTISLSHREGHALCTVARTSIDLGCDLENIEPRSNAFVSDYFTAEEQAMVASRTEADRHSFLALLWSAKESALKALQTGLRLDTRSVCVSFDAKPDVNGWSPLQVRYAAAGKNFHGWWQSAPGIIRTMVASPAPKPPLPLRASAYYPENAAWCA